MKKIARFFGTLIWMVPLFLVIMLVMMIASVTIEKRSIITKTSPKEDASGLNPS
jgi:hypothetical protein